MAKDIRSSFVRDWVEMSQREYNPFNKFYMLWTALTAAAQGYKFRENDSDRAKVRDYFRENADTIFQILEDNRRRMVFLSVHRGTDYNDPIIDTKDDNLRKRFTELSAYYTSPNIDLPHERLVDTLAELFIKIKTTLFHRDLSDNRRDILILNGVNPILQEILEKCEPSMMEE